MSRDYLKNPLATVERSDFYWLCFAARLKLRMLKKCPYVPGYKAQAWAREKAERARERFEMRVASYAMV